MDTRIYCMTHKKFTPLDMEGYIPLHVGRALSDDIGYLGDNTGDNISVKNKTYCELTGMYWIWKNISCDIVGVCHYRRYFINDEDFISKDFIEKTLNDYDIIVSHSGHTDRPNVRIHYDGWHIAKDMDVTRAIIAEMYPEYLPAFDHSMNCNFVTIGNMILTQKSIYDEYCSWLFPLMFEIEKRTDVSQYDDYQARLYGFLAERLFRVWLLNHNYSIKEIEVRMIDPESRNNDRKFVELCTRFTELNLNNLISRYENNDPYDICDISPKSIDFHGKIPAFACWWQGLDEVPEMVMNCLNSIDKYLPADKFEFHLITLENVFNYIDLPDWIIDKYNREIITPTHLSDILRMGLLYRYGGLWIDATYFATRPFDEEIFEKDFWTLCFKKPLWKLDIADGKWSGNIMYSKPGNLLHRFALNAFYEYWRAQDKLIAYFLIDHIIEIAYRRIPGIKDMIDSVEPSNPHCHSIRPMVNLAFNETIWNKISKDTYLFKLQRRDNAQAQNIIGELTYYGKLLEYL